MNSMFNNTNHKGTRRGVKANHPGVKLICITNGKEVRRIGRNIADPLVLSGEWRYCPKKFKLEN